MTGPALIPGATYHVGAACGVPHGFRPIRFRLIRELPHNNWQGMARLDGYEIDDRGHAAERRDIYVIAAGLRLLDLPYTRTAVTRRPRNTRAVTRPRTPAPTTSGSTR